VSSHRKEKLEELVKRLIGDLLLKDIKDSRIGFVSISKVKLSRDYGIADVYFSVLGENKAIKDTFFGLESAKGYIRKKIGKSLQLRHIPDIKFIYDDSVAEGVDLVNLIDRVNAEISNDPDEQ
jgi:ribosome-binding factor A